MKIGMVTQLSYSTRGGTLIFIGINGRLLKIILQMRGRCSAFTYIRLVRTGDAANNAIKTKINATTGVIDADFRDTANDNGIIFSGE